MLTGRPGCGKTTLVRKVLRLSGVRAAGFYTEEVRHDGRRVGFDLVTLRGTRVPLAREGLPSPHRVGRYGVEVRSVEVEGVSALEEALAGGYLAVVDEIGKMELFSGRFRDTVHRLLDTGVPVLGTVMLAPHPWADRLKQDDRVDVVGLTAQNRGQVLEQTLAWLKEVVG
ncbi:MAG: AAA family ATPase [Chloroflexi bacterium]|nr:AAA family ATPase [Chloroflexota bacterium]